MNQAWALYRDGKLYGAWREKAQALDTWAFLRPGSKHRWGLKRVLVGNPKRKMKVPKR